MRFLIAIILASITTVAVGQGKADLDKLDEAIARHLSNGFTGWTHQRVAAFGPDSNTLVESWSLPNRTVKITVSVGQSAEEAKNSLLNFLKYKREVKELRGLGDDAYSFGVDSCDVVLRRGRYLLYVSTVADVEGDPDARTITKAELSSRRKSERQKIGKDFARLLATVDLP
jgi:hypothetical protein